MRQDRLTYKIFYNKYLTSTPNSWINVTKGTLCELGYRHVFEKMEAVNLRLIENALLKKQRIELFAQCKSKPKLRTFIKLTDESTVVLLQCGC